MSRRAALAGALGSSAAWAFGDASKFVPAVAKHQGTWDTRLSGLTRLAWELQRATSVEVRLEPKPLALDSPELFTHPFLSLSTETELPPLSATEVEGLRRYVTFGGFLFVDAASGALDSPADRSLRRELARVLPQQPLKELPKTHVIYKSFFLLEGAYGRVLAQPGFEACVLNRRAAVVYSANDVLGALARDELGGFLYECTPQGEHQRKLAVRTALNVAMYALCLDYKDDAVHAPQILNRRR